MEQQNVSIFIAFLGRSPFIKYKTNQKIKIWTIFDRENNCFHFTKSLYSVDQQVVTNIIQITKRIQVASAKRTLPRYAINELWRDSRYGWCHGLWSLVYDRVVDCDVHRSASMTSRWERIHLFLF